MIFCAFSLRSAGQFLAGAMPPPRDPLTFPQALPGVVRPGAQQASWSSEPSFSLILQRFSSPRVMRNRSGSDLEGVGRRRADMEGLGAFSAMLECIIIDAEHSIRDIFSAFRTSGWSCYGNFQILMTVL